MSTSQPNPEQDPSREADQEQHQEGQQQRQQRDRQQSAQQDPESPYLQHPGVSKRYVGRGRGKSGSGKAAGSGGASDARAPRGGATGKHTAEKKRSGHLGSLKKWLGFTFLGAIYIASMMLLDDLVFGDGDAPWSTSSEEGAAAVQAERGFPASGLVDERISQAKEAGEDPAVYAPEGTQSYSGLQEPAPARARDKEVPSKSTYELTPLEAGQIANIGGLRIAVGPVRDMGKYHDGQNTLCHDMSFLNMTDDNQNVSRDYFSLTTPSGRNVESSLALGFPTWSSGVERGETNSGVVCYKADADPGMYTVNFTPYPGYATLAQWKSGLGG